MSKSKIEWTDETWNITTGCTRVSEGCDNCYAVAMTKRLAAIESTSEKYGGLVKEGKDHFNGTIKLHPSELEKPLHWRKPRRVFVNSMSDLFHPEVPFEFVAAAFGVMAYCRDHTFQVLTKRPDRMAEFFEWIREGDMKQDGKSLRYDEAQKCITFAISKIDHQDTLLMSMTNVKGREWPLPNVWLGTSIENQDYISRVIDLLNCPAAVRFLSLEPLLGPVNLKRFIPLDRYYMTKCEHCGWVGSSQMLDTVKYHDDEDILCPECTKSIAGNDGPKIHWVITGGESGPNARPMHPDWVRTLRNQCQNAGVPFFFKQWGKYRYAERKPFQGPTDMGHSDYWYVDKGCGEYAGYPATLGMGVDEVDNPPEIIEDGEPYPDLIGWKVGKKNAGRLLDGREWNQLP